MYSEQLMNYLYHYQLEEVETKKESTTNKRLKNELPILKVLKNAYVTVPINNEK